MWGRGAVKAGEEGGGGFPGGGVGVLRVHGFAVRPEGDEPAVQVDGGPAEWGQEDAGELGGRGEAGARSAGVVSGA